MGLGIVVVTTAEAMNAFYTTEVVEDCHGGMDWPAMVLFEMVVVGPNGGKTVVRGFVGLSWLEGEARKPCATVTGKRRRGIMVRRGGEEALCRGGQKTAIDLLITESLFDRHFRNDKRRKKRSLRG
jgi:hypothetical protein